MSVRPIDEAVGSQETVNAQIWSSAMLIAAEAATINPVHFLTGKAFST
jgi:hypothetical protein